MGRFCSGIFIRKQDGDSKESVTKRLCEYMKENGYVLSTENNSDATYILSFSEKSKWFALGLGGSSMPHVKLEKKAILCSQIWNTKTIMLELVDSDFVVVGLYGSNGKLLDQRFIGEESMKVDIKPSKHWSAILKQDVTLDNLLEIFNEQAVFAEDVIEKFADVVEMDEKPLYYRWSDVDETDDGIVELYFKCVDKTKKIPTFKAMFKQKFGEYLMPLGFVKMKGANHYFIRPIGDEIIQVITFVNQQPIEADVEGFRIFSGIATVYRESLDMKTNSWANTNWLDCLCSYYSKLNVETCQNDIWESLYCITYKEDDVVSMDEALEYAINMTKELVIPLFDEVTDLESALMFLRKYGSCLRIFDVEQDFGNYNVNNHYEEGMLFVKTNYRGDFCELIQKREDYERLEKIMKEKNRYWPDEPYEEYYQKKIEYANERRKKLNSILDNPENYAKAQAELERRKMKNIGHLRSFGILK